MMLDQLKLFESSESLLKIGNYFQETDFVSVKSKNVSDYNETAAICKNWIGESGNGMRGMMRARGIRVGMRGINVGIRGIRVGMRIMGGGNVGNPMNTRNQGGNAGSHDGRNAGNQGGNAESQGGNAGNQGDSL